MRSKMNGAVAPGTCSASHADTRATSIPAGAVAVAGAPYASWSPGRSTTATLAAEGRRRGPAGRVRSAGSLRRMAIDVTDATFQTEVIERSQDAAVVVDLWAPWCGPCRTLGPIIEKVVDATEGQVVLTKVNIDENPQIAAAFQAQSIPAVYALRDGRVVDGFIGAYPEEAVRQFVDSLRPSDAE